jgi:hypothetical protein
MSESALGFSVAVTRQKAGRRVSGFARGGTNLPDVTTSALVMVVCGNCRAARASQLAKERGCRRANPARERTCKLHLVGLGVNKGRVY